MHVSMKISLLNPRGLILFFNMDADDYIYYPALHIAVSENILPVDKGSWYFPMIDRCRFCTS